MKVGFIGSRGVPANYGGFETYVHNISRELSELGVDVFVVNPHHRRVSGDTCDGANVIYAYDFEPRFKNRYIRGALTILYDLFSMIVCIMRRVDCIIVCGYASGPLLFVPRIFGVKVFVNPDGFEWKSTRWGRAVFLWLKFCEWCAVKSSTILICDSVRIAEYFSGKFKVNPRVIEYGSYVISDVLPFSGIPVAAVERGYYLACARMVPETKIDEIIRGFVGSRSENVLLVVGPIKDEQYFTQMVLPLIDSNRNVFYLGAIYETGVLPAFRYHAKALLHGHASDGTNPSLIESMGCSSVVLAIDRPSNRKPLAKADHVFWSDAASLSLLIDDFETWSTARVSKEKQKNRLEIERHFSWKSKAIAHLEIFSQTQQDDKKVRDQNE